MTDRAADRTADQERIAQRADLLPEERVAGSEDPQQQAAAILEESDDRTARPEQTGAGSPQTSTPDERPSVEQPGVERPSAAEDDG